MFPTMYGSYQRSQLGQTQSGGAGPVVIIDGVQKLTSAGNKQIAGFLSTLYLGVPSPDPNHPAVPIFQALPCEQAKNTGATCDDTALNSLKTRPPGSTVLIDYATANAGVVIVYIVTDQATVKLMAAPPDTLAVFDPSEALGEKKKEKVETSTLLVGVGAGGLAGFVVGGPVGAVVGAVGGGVLTNWVA